MTAPVDDDACCRDDRVGGRGRVGGIHVDHQPTGAGGEQGQYLGEQGWPVVGLDEGEELGGADALDLARIAPQPLERGVVQHDHVAVGGEAHVDLDDRRALGERRPHRRQGVLAQDARVPAMGAGARRHRVTRSTSRPSRYTRAEATEAYSIAPTAGGGPGTKASRVASSRRTRTRWKGPCGTTRSTRDTQPVKEWTC